MCLAIPGEVLSIAERGGLRTGVVSFGGATREICLAYVPDVRVGDYVLAHAGFAITIVDEEEARATLAMLDELSEEDAGSG